MVSCAAWARVCLRRIGCMVGPVYDVDNPGTALTASAGLLTEKGRNEMWALRKGVGAVLLSSLLTAQVNEKPADALRGKTLFEGKGKCTSCHRVGETGSGLGPNLTDIATRLTPEQLRKSLLDPDPTVPPAYQRYRVVTHDGKAISGKLLNQDPYSLQMINADNQLVAFERSQLREWRDPNPFHAFLSRDPQPQRTSRHFGLSRIAQRRDPLGVGFATSLTMPDAG